MKKKSETSQGSTILSHRGYLRVFQLSLALFLCCYLVMGYYHFENRAVCLSNVTHKPWTREWILFICGGLLVGFCLQLNRIFLSTFRQENTLGTRSTYYATLTINCIAVISCFSIFTFNWGGICRDAFGVEFPALTWIEWIITVPLLMFITVSVDDKPYLSTEDILLVGSQFVSLAFCFLTTSTSNKHFRLFSVVFSFLSFLPLYRFTYLSFQELQELIRRGQDNPTRKSLLERKVLLVSRKVSMALCLAFLYPIFPIIYVCRWFNIFDDDFTFVAFIFASAFMKLFFSSVCMDSHLEVSHPVIALIDAEKFAHTTRRAFLRYVFHEVRVPLNSIALGIQVLNESKETSSSDRETISLMKEAVSFMGETLNDVMALQTIEDGSLELLLKPFSLLDLFQNIEHSFQDVAKEMEITLDAIVDSEVPRILIGDKYRLRHVLANLVSNAIKYSRAGSTVKLQASLSSLKANDHQLSLRDPIQTNGTFQMIVFQVEDHGKGISKEEQEANIFQPYRSLISGNLTEGRGSGLGLAICKEIVHMHGGEISYRSELGVGTTFFVHIPFEVYNSENSDQIWKHLQSKAIIGKGTLDSHYSILTAPVSGKELKSDDNSSKELAQFSPFSSEKMSLQSWSREVGNESFLLSFPEQVGDLKDPKEPAEEEAINPVSPTTTVTPSTTPLVADDKNELNHYSGQLSIDASLFSASRSIDQTRILVVDDVESNSKFLSKLLAIKGITQIDTAENGAKAVALVEKALTDGNPYDLIFMDNTMPVMNGVTATRKMRALGFPNLIIGVTANCMEDELTEFRDSGADLVLTKPMKLDMIGLFIQLVLEGDNLSYASKTPPQRLVLRQNCLKWELIKEVSKSSKDGI